LVQMKRQVVLILVICSLLTGGLLVFAQEVPVAGEQITTTEDLVVHTPLVEVTDRLSRLMATSSLDKASAIKILAAKDDTDRVIEVLVSIQDSLDRIERLLK